MAKLLKLRRGTTTEHNSFTGAAGEVTVNTTTNGLVVHDGTTQGGHPSLGANSPALTGTPTAPTAGSGTNTTQIATTAFVTAALPDISGKANIASPTFTGTVTIPTGASIADYAPLASPTFTGTPAAPTAAADTNTTQVATTAYVQTELGDYATLASPTFTGTPTVPGYAALAGATFSGKITAQVATVGEIDEIADDTGGTVTISLDTSANYKTATFAAARTLANPSAKTIGACGSIFVTGPGFTGYGSQWMFPGGTGPTYTNTASKWDRIDFIVLDASTIMCNFTANYGAPS